MAIERSDAVAYLTGTYGSGANNLLGQASIPTTDTGGDLKEVIDSAYLLLLRDADLIGQSIPGDKALAFYAALDYAALSRILLGLNRKVDVDVGAGDGVTLRGSQLTEKVQWMLAGATSRCMAYGLTVAAGTETAPRKSWGSLNPALDDVGWSVDFIEPDIEE